MSTEISELTDDELDAVSGGDLSITKVLDQPSSTLGDGGGGSPTPTSAWNTLLYQYGYLK
jgi:bacteriocin-like protein